jgi:hypothetical protein
VRLIRFGHTVYVALLRTVQYLHVRTGSSTYYKLGPTGVQHNVRALYSRNLRHTARGGVYERTVWRVQ